MIIQVLILRVENHFLLPQSKFEELSDSLKEIKTLVLEIRNKPRPFQDWIPKLEAQKLLGLKETSLWSLRRRKKLISSKVGARVFYSIKSIEKLMRKNQE